MFTRLNQRLKAKTSENGAYNDLDKETDNNDARLVSGASTSPPSQGNSFMFSGNENINSGLGYSVEMSAAGAGVVPDGWQKAYALLIPCYY